MKKSCLEKLSVVLIIVFCFALLSGCASQKLSGDFDETDIKSAAEDIIAFINSQDSASIRALCTMQMKEALTDEVFDQIYEAIGEGGAFSKVEEMSITATTDEASDEEFAVVVARAKYEHRSFIYTIALTKQMKIAGLYHR